MSFFNHWWNLPYLIMLGLVGAFFVLQVIGLVGHDADVDHDADIDHDVDADADAEHDVGGTTAGFHEVLAFFGLGRVPFMVIWLTLCIFTGFSGLFLNRVTFAHNGDVSVGMFFAVLAVASMTLGMFNRDQLQGFLDEKAAGGLSFSTIDHLRWDLRQVFEMAVAEGFLLRNPAKLLFTRIDETTEYGALVNEAARRGLPISFLTTGQKIPDDLEPATKRRLTALVEGRTENPEPALSRGASA